MGIIDSIKRLFTPSRREQAGRLADRAKDQIRNAGPNAAERGLGKTPLKDNARAQGLARQADNLATNFAGDGKDVGNDVSGKATGAAGSATSSAESAASRAINDATPKSRGPSPS